MTLRLHNERPKQPIWKKLLQIAVLVGFAFSNLGACAAFGAYVYFGHDIPSVAWAEDYRPPIITNVYSNDEQLVGEFYNERRVVVPYEKIPRKLVQAFVASEDQRFFDHGGIDTIGVANAILQGLTGRKVRGASTLTQQTAKAILISNEGFQQATARKLRRKVREAILARRLEQRFSKEEILHLYLNQVYLGHHSYGVQAAAWNYFRKNVWDLTLAEMSLLAGLPQAPSRYSPFSHPDRAKLRRAYVLRRMHEERMIHESERQTAESAEIAVYPVEDVFRDTAPFFTEHVRRDIVARYGNDRLLGGDLTVEMTVSVEKERAAEVSTTNGIVEADKRQGYRGPFARLGGEEAIQTFRDEVARLVGPGELAPGRIYPAVVLKAAEKEATVAVGARVGSLPLATMRWAHDANPELWHPTSLIDNVRKALKPGDAILVRRLTAAELAEAEGVLGTRAKKEAPPGLVFGLEQEPRLQGALVSIDPVSGYVVAMIGAYDFAKSEFNRAFQACRQPGSAFKPLVYSAAFEKLGYTASTILVDSPIVYDDVETEKRWKPNNFDEGFKGDVPLRTALIHSMNIPAVKTAQAVGAKAVADWAHRVGITTKINEDLSVALGSSCVYLWELTQVYATFNRNGLRPEVRFVRRVLDRDGNVLEDHTSHDDPWSDGMDRIAGGYAKLLGKPVKVMEPDTAYLTTQLMNEVCTFGTGAAASRLGKPVAGKTGTTNDAFDAWFVGFTRDLVTGSWVGYDEYTTPMAKWETGGHTALPIWLDYMQRALRARPQEKFPAPDGIVWVRIDPDTGLLAQEGARQSVLEAYKEGTEPTETAPDKGTRTVNPIDFMREEGI